MVQLKAAGDEGFGVYIACRTPDALARFVASSVSRRLSEILESVFSKLSGEQIVIVQLGWVDDYRRCAEHFIDANAVGMYIMLHIIYLYLNQGRSDGGGVYRYIYPLKKISLP